MKVGRMSPSTPGDEKDREKTGSRGRTATREKPVQRPRTGARATESARGSESARDGAGRQSAAKRTGEDKPIRTRRSDVDPRGSRSRGSSSTRRPREPHASTHGPQSAPTARPAERPARAKTTSQAKARAKARKAKAPKIVRPPLRDRLVARLAEMDFRPQTLIAKVPFVVLIIGALGVGLGITLWLSTDAAQRSYQLGSARSTNEALSQQKEALERDVLVADSAPALADAARNLGMIPSKDTAHLVQDPAGNWIVVGQPKPAEGAPPPPLNAKLPDDKPLPPGPAKPVPAVPAPGSSAEVPTRLTPLTAGQLPGQVPGATGLAGVLGAPGSEVAVRIPSATDPNAHLPLGAALPGPGAVTGLPAAPGVPVSPGMAGVQLPAIAADGSANVPAAPAAAPAVLPLPPVSPTTGLTPDATNESLAGLPPVPPVLTAADLAPTSAAAPTLAAAPTSGAGQ